MTSLYDVLEIDKNASDLEVRNAYKKLAKVYHPDKCSDDKKEENEKKFKKIKEAYDILSDRQKRFEYDNPNTRFHNFFDTSFFSASNRYGNETMCHISITVPLTLEEVYTGITKKIEYERLQKCDNCNSMGYTQPNDATTCHVCNGKGIIEQHIQMGFMTQVISNCCNFCNGRGLIITRACETCQGNLTISKSKSVNIKFPSAVNHAENIVLQGKGNYYPRMQTTTDVIIIVQILPHEKFQRIDKYDLMYTLDVTLDEALCGFNKTIIHLDNSEIKVESNDIINPSTITNYADMGINHKGTLFVKYNIIFPSELDEFIKKILSRSISSK